MEDRQLLNSRLLGNIAEKVHEENLPVEIEEGKRIGGLIDVLFVYPDTFRPDFDRLVDTVFNETFGPLEGGGE